MIDGDNRGQHYLARPRMQVVRIAHCSPGGCTRCGWVTRASSPHIFRKKHTSIAARLHTSKSVGRCYTSLRAHPSATQDRACQVLLEGYGSLFCQRIKSGEISFMHQGKEWAQFVLVESGLPCGRRRHLACMAGFADLRR